jgi:hypothetical protein
MSTPSDCGALLRAYVEQIRKIHRRYLHVLDVCVYVKGSAQLQEEARRWPRAAVTRFAHFIIDTELYTRQ